MSTAAPLPGVIRDKLLAMDRQQRELAAVRGVGQFLLVASAATAQASAANDQNQSVSAQGAALCERRAKMFRQPPVLSLF